MDGMPNALIEAMALGKPVISTYVSGIPELIKDGAGILVPPEDSKALAKAIEGIYFMDLETRKRMGRKGYEIVGMEFNIKKESEKLKDLFLF
jgi:glycosyltransferase involved in cell wall biosynthesis